MDKPHPMVLAAARVLCSRHAEAFWLEEGYCWDKHGEDFLAEAKAALEACGALDLLAALEAEQEWQERDADGALDPDWDYEAVVGDKRRAAITKATT